jgi:hypothetical protein
VFDDPWISLPGIARLDLVDVSAYRTLIAALEDRWAGYSLEMAIIEV